MYRKRMDLSKIGPGKNAPEEINVLIEIPQGVSVKYELDKKSGAIFVDRFLYTAMVFPFNYGFVPQTQGGDGDPVDVVVLCRESLGIGVVIRAKPIGLLAMEDEAGEDSKIIAVPTKKADPKFGAYNDIAQVPKETKERIVYFFENYKTLEPGKWVKVKGWKGKREALEVVKKAMENQ